MRIDEQHRMMTLETMVAEQERTIGELSDQIARQWRVIDDLTRRLERLTDRLATVEEQAGPDVPVTRPPHY